MYKQEKAIPLLIFAVIVVVLRDPSLFVSPRFWGEEGVIYFTYARENHLLDAFLKPHLGYYSFWANLAALISARFVPLHAAPYVTTYMAFLAQLLPFVVVIWGNSQLWNNGIKKILVIVVILFAPLSGEVWLNTINSHFYFCLTVFLLLFEPVPPKRIMKCLGGGLIFLSCVSSVICCFLLPMYFLKFILNREKKEHLFLFLIMFAAVLIQISVVLSTSGAEDLQVLRDAGINPPERSTSISLPVLGHILLLKSICLPFLGVQVSQNIAAEIHSIRGSNDVLFSISGYAGLTLVAAFLTGLFSQVKGENKYFLFGSYFLLVTLSTVFSRPDMKWVIIDPVKVQRYYYIPNIIILLALLSAINFALESNSAKIRNTLMITMLGITLFWGGSVFRSSLNDLNFFKGDLPVWAREVEKWQGDNSYKLKIWPRGWRMSIKKCLTDQE